MAMKFTAQDETLLHGALITAADLWWSAARDEATALSDHVDDREAALATLKLAKQAEELNTRWDLEIASAKARAEEPLQEWELELLAVHDERDFQDREEALIKGMSAEDDGEPFEIPVIPDDHPDAFPNVEAQREAAEKRRSAEALQVLRERLDAKAEAPGQPPVPDGYVGEADEEFDNELQTLHNALKIHVKQGHTHKFDICRDNPCRGSRAVDRTMLLDVERLNDTYVQHSLQHTDEHEDGEAVPFWRCDNPKCTTWSPMLRFTFNHAK